MGASLSEWKLFIVKALRQHLVPLIESKVTWGVFSSYINTLIGIFCNFILIPLYLKYLGRQDYGLWIAISGIVAYLRLLNLGIGQSTANLFGMAVARKEGQAAARALATGFWSYSKIVGVGLVFLCAVGPWIPWSFLVKGPVSTQNETTMVVMLSAGAFLVELPFTLFGGCLGSIGEIHLQQGISAVQSIGRLLVALVYLGTGGGLRGLIVALGATNLMFAGANFIFLRLRVSTIGLSWHLKDAALSRSMRGPSLFFFLLQLSGAITFSSDALVISCMLGVNEVTPYGIAQRLMFLMVGAVNTISANFAPVFLRTHSRNERDALQNNFLRVLKLCVVCGTLASAGFIAFGPSFIRWWVGASNFVGLPSFILMVLLIPLQMVLAPADALLVVTGKHKMYAVCALWEAFLSLCLSIAFASRWGVTGVILGTLIGRVLGAGPILLWNTLLVLRGRFD